MSKKCHSCGSDDVYVKVLYPYHSVNLACCRACGHSGEEPEFTITTVFDRITASMEALARSLCGNVRVGCFSGYYSMLTGLYYPDMDKAIAATIEKLKEVVDE